MTRRPIRPIAEPGVQVKPRKRSNDALGETIVLAVAAVVIYPWYYLYRKVRAYF